MAAEAPPPAQHTLIGTTHMGSFPTGTVSPSRPRTPAEASSLPVQPPQAPADLPAPLVIAGPSGVGKGTLISRLRSTFPQVFGYSISHTTRAPRENEIDGVHYHFTTPEKLLALANRGEMLEYAEVHGRLYGTSIAAVEEVRLQRKICILEIDVQGVRQLKTSPLGHITRLIFIAPPSLEELERRLRARGTESEASIAERVRNAKGEIDACGELGFHRVIENDDLNTAFAQLCATLAEWYPASFPGANESNR